MSRIGIPHWIIPAALLLVAIGLRASDLGSTCLWFDEVFSVHAATHSWTELIQFVAQDVIHPPLYYIVLKLWIGVGGESVEWMRGLSVVWFLASLVPAFLLVRELRLTLANQIFTVSTLLVSGQLVKYSLEVRMYAQVSFLCAMSLWILVRVTHGRSKWFILAIVNFLLVYTHYYGWFVILAELIAAAILYRESLRRIAVAAIACMIGFLPWIYLIFNASAGRSDLDQNIGWVKAPGARELTLFVLNLIEPFYFQSSSDQPASAFWVTVPLALAILTASVVYLLRPSRDDSSRESLLLCTILFAVPVNSALILSWIMPHSIWGTRHLLIVMVPMAICLGIIIAGQSTKVRAGLIAGMLLFACGGLYFHLAKNDSRPVWCACEDLSREARARQDLPIYTLEDLTAYHAWFTLKGDAPTIYRVSGGFGMPEDKAYFLPRGVDEVRVVPEDQIKDVRFYLIYRAKTWNETEPPLRNLTVKGYRFELIRQIPAGRETAFLIEAQTRP